MKKLLGILLSVIISISLFTNIYAYSEDLDDHQHDESFEELQFEGEIEFIGDITVEVKNLEEALNYPRAPNYRYTFNFTELLPSRTRSNYCSSCLKPYMSLGGRSEQILGRSIQCPINGWGNDLFSQFAFKSYEQCSYCGYRSSEWTSYTYYTAKCYYGGGNFEPTYSKTMSKGYDIHDTLAWWIDRKLS